MPASKAEQVLDALKALLQALPDVSVERNSVLPEKSNPPVKAALRGR